MTQESINQLLRKAASQNALEQAKQLLAAGADCYAVDESGHTAFNLAASNGLSVLALLVEEAFQDSQQSKRQRRWQDYELNTASGYYGSTLITYAAKVSPVFLVKQMIDAGADLRIINNSGWTLLHCAAVMPERLQVIKELISALQVQGLEEIINALSTHLFETDYKGYKVVYGKNLSAAQLCQTRMQQDPEYPPELSTYLPYLNFTAGSS